MAAVKWHSTLGVQPEHNRHLEEVIPYEQQEIAIENQRYRGQQLYRLDRTPSTTLPRLDLDEHERTFAENPHLNKHYLPKEQQKTLKEHIHARKIEQGLIQGPLEPMTVRLYNVITGILLVGWKNAKTTGDLFEDNHNRYAQNQTEIPNFVGSIFYGFGRLAQAILGYLFQYVLGARRGYADI